MIRALVHTLQHAATRCNTLQHPSHTKTIHGSLTLQHTATHCNTLRYAGANNTFVLKIASRASVHCSPSNMTISNSGSNYIAGDLIAASPGNDFRAAFTVDNFAISAVRVLNLGSGYSSDAILTPVYAGTTTAMENSVTMVKIFSGGRNYISVRPLVFVI